VTGKPARFVRIELPGDKRILTLAEVEVFSAGKNIAREGKASQSSTNGEGVAARAIDGNKDPEWGKHGQTHTSNSGEKNPWWEVDLGHAVAIEKVQIWNRTGFESRLDGFTIKLLDADRKEVFRITDVRAPQAMEIDVQNEGRMSYLSYAGAPGKPAELAKNDPKAKPEPKGKGAADPVLADVPAGYRDPAPFAFKKGVVVHVSFPTAFFTPYPDGVSGCAGVPRFLTVLQYRFVACFQLIACGP